MLIDGTYVHAHHHAAGAKGGRKKQALSHSCRVFTSQPHVSVAAFGNPIDIILSGGQTLDAGGQWGLSATRYIILSGGQTSDITVAAKLIESHANCNVIADKGYGSNDFVASIEFNNCQAVIQPRSNRKTSRDYDR